MSDPKMVPALTLRTTLTSVLDEVSRGSTYVITRYGRPIAVFSPPGVQMEHTATAPSHRKPPEPIQFTSSDSISARATITGPVKAAPLSREELEAIDRERLQRMKPQRLQSKKKE